MPQDPKEIAKRARSGQTTITDLRREWTDYLQSVGFQALADAVFDETCNLGKVGVGAIE